MDLARRELKAAAEERGYSLAHLSAIIGRNRAYLGQYLDRGSPRRLDDLDRRNLAIYLEIDECRLGARLPYMPGAH